MTKADLHRLVDALPEESVVAAGALLARAQDPVLAKLDAAPDDDEPYTDAQRRAVEAAVGEPGVPWDQVEPELAAD
jgi:hypothetical protein